jgi:hypothetical protein
LAVHGIKILLQLVLFGVRLRFVLAFFFGLWALDDLSRGVGTKSVYLLKVCVEGVRGKKSKVLEEKEGKKEVVSHTARS